MLSRDSAYPDAAVRSTNGASRDRERQTEGKAERENVFAQARASIGEYEVVSIDGGICAK
jgi:hypothetical protein